MFRAGRRAEMSADPPARKRRPSGVCANRAHKSDERSREDKAEATNQGSGDALNIHSFPVARRSHLPGCIPRDGRSVYKRA
jgi:hypothetical protein